MLHELRTYTVHPRALDEYVEITGGLGMSIRGDRHGRLLGYWIARTGRAGQVMHLWEYPDVAARAEMRAALMQNVRWLDEYIPQTQPYLVEQECMLLNPKPFCPVEPSSAGLYELRIDQLRPGAMREWDSGFSRLIDRPGAERPVGAWAVEVGRINTVLHLWPRPIGSAYDDRQQAPSAPDKVDWDNLDRLTVASDRRLLEPSRFSPLA